MSTTALVSTNPVIDQAGILPTKKSPRQIVREEIKREKQLDALKQKYENGEISKFEYTVGKALLNLPVSDEKIPGNVVFSTTA